MKLSKKQFDNLLKNNKLAISLIGMSNIGKTYWSKKLSTIRFKHISCDDLIEKNLAPELKKLSYKGIEDVAKWMGQPYEKRSAKNQKKYLDFEREILKKIVANLKPNRRKNIAIDTTGSFVHTGKKICSAVKKHSFIVHIEASEKNKKQLFENYIKNPKPVIWGNVFKKKKNESNKSALRRCYKNLLKIRNSLYGKYADATIPQEAIKKNISTNQFLLLIKQFIK